MGKTIYVTQPSLPPIEEFTKILSKSWNKKHLTNDGPLHKEFELKLSKFLGVKHLSLFNNATIALLVAQKAVGFKKEIITTPFSFIATSHSIIWNGFKPVFVDTDKQAGNLDIKEVEKAINKNTGGILAVHNFGIPGDINGLQRLAKKNSLPLIFDAAPCMGVKYNNRSILQYGDLSVLSFHATKVFTTFEGGAIIAKSLKMKKKIDELKNFAIKGPEKINGLGINGKMNEAEAAMGILQLKYFNKNIHKRRKIFDIYNQAFSKAQGIELLKFPKKIEYNFAYYPIFIKKGQQARDQIHKKLNDNDVVCRKYWYPLITKHDIYKSFKHRNTPNAQKLSESILCLPIFPDLKSEVQSKIINIIADLI